MATIYDLKPAFQNRLRPLTRRLAGRGFTANQVTLTALALSLATGALLAALGRSRPEMYLMLPAVLLIRMALNAIDGMLAREHGMQSALGAVLNELSDAISDTALYLPFALLPGVLPAWVVLAVAGALLTEMAGVVAVQIGASRRYDDRWARATGPLSSARQGSPSAPALYREYGWTDYSESSWHSPY